MGENVIKGSAMAIAVALAVILLPARSVSTAHIGSLQRPNAPNTAIPQLDKSYDLDSDGTATYDLSPPDAGWPTGTYEIVVTMVDNGTTRDTKSTEFTVAQ